MSAELATFLRARLDDDERIARRAAARQTGGESWTYEQPSVETAGALTVAKRMVPVFGEHVARHDPARVLREVEAKRQLLHDYEATVRLRDETATRIKAAGNSPDPKELQAWSQTQCEAAVLEGAVQLAALPFDDRPGYRDEWRP